MDGVENLNLGAESVDSSEKLSVSGGEGGLDAEEKARLEAEYPEELIEASDGKLANENVTSKFPKLKKFDSVSNYETGFDEVKVRGMLKRDWYAPEGGKSDLYYGRKGMDISKPEEGDVKVRYSAEDGGHGLHVFYRKDSRWEPVADVLVLE